MMLTFYFIEFNSVNLLFIFMFYFFLMVLNKCHSFIHTSADHRGPTHWAIDVENA